LKAQVVFTNPAAWQTIIPWTFTAALLLVWSAGVLTGNRYGGAIDGFLISGATMVLVSLFFGRKLISAALPEVV
jgi:uncharacterized membrane protein